MLEIDDYAGNTPNRCDRRNVGALTPRFHQPGCSVPPFSYPQSRDEYPLYPSWPAYHGYTSAESNVQLQVKLDKIMDAQLETRKLIDNLSSRVTKLEHSWSSKSSSSCSSSPETETKRVSPQLSVSIDKVFNIHEYSITETSCTNS